MGYRSLTVIKTGTIQKLGCGFLYSPSMVTMRYLVLFARYSNLLV